ncbi:MAG: PAS domain S-box protein [Desulfomonilaceae bacterium]
MDVTPGIRAEAESEKEVNKFRVLYDLAVAMTAGHDLDENLSLVVEQSRELLGFDSSYIALRDERAGDVYMHTLSGITTEAFKQMRLPFGAGVGGKVAATQKGVIVGDYFQDVESPVHDIVRAEGLISGIAVPIQMGQTNLGVLYGFNRAKTSFSQSDLDTLFLLGNLAAVEITRKRQEIDLRQARDELEQKVQERTAELSAANENLKQSEEKYRLVVEKAQEAIFVAQDGMLQFANPKTLDLLAYSEDEFLSKAFTEFIHPDDREMVLDKHLRRLRGEQFPTRYSFRLLDKDGTVKWVEIDSALISWDGRPAALIFLTDITERVRMEQALKRSEERYRALAENSLTGICVHQDGLHVYVNERYANGLGYSAAELIGKPLLEVVAQQDREMVWQRCLDRLAGKRVPSQYQLRSLNKDGSVRWMEVWATVIEHNGSPAILANIFDISERKAAEEALRDSEKKYRTILETIADGYHEVDLAGNLTLVNDSMCEILGYPREELLGVNFRKLMDEDNAKSIFKAYNQVYRTGKPNPGFNYQNLRKDGSRRDVSVSISRINDTDGQPRGFRGIMRDVTERNKLQEQLYQAAKMEAIGTLAGGIAHDFNNLLQVVQGYTDLLLLRKNKEDPDYDKLRAMRGAAQRGRDLVQQILTFSRKVETKPRPVDLNNELRQTEQLLRGTIEKMISIEMDLADNLWPISSDPVQIEQILLNLAVNAKQAMPKGGRLMIETKNIKLDEEYCRTHLKTKPGRYVLLMVSDTGHGMDKEVVERIFEPFFTTKDPGEGTGLGLATVFGLVKSHDGHISCYSEPGFGTTFKIYFPAIETEWAWSQETTQELPAFGTETLLIVDDEESIRELTKELLSEVGYKVLTAASGREAIDIYSKGKEAISLIMLDLIMPKMDGKACLEELLKVNPDVKVLLASGYSANGPARQAIASGAKGLINKPYDVRKLLRMVRAVLDAE